MHLLNFYGPTQGIFRHGIASFRKQRAAAPVSTVFGVLTAVITFSEDLTAGDEVGFTATVNALGNVVVTALLTSANVITVTWTTPGVATNAVIIDYDGLGSWLTAVGGDALRPFSVNGVIP